MIPVLSAIRAGSIVAVSLRGGRRERQRQNQTPKPASNRPAESTEGLVNKRLVNDPERTRIHVGTVTGGNAQCQPGVRQACAPLSSLRGGPPARNPETTLDKFGSGNLVSHSYRCGHGKSTESRSPMPPGGWGGHLIFA